MCSLFLQRGLWPQQRVGKSPYPPRIFGWFHCNDILSLRFWWIREYSLRATLRRRCWLSERKNEGFIQINMCFARVVLVQLSSRFTRLCLRNTRKRRENMKFLLSTFATSTHCKFSRSKHIAVAQISLLHPVMIFKRKNHSRRVIKILGTEPHNGWSITSSFGADSTHSRHYLPILITEKHIWRSLQDSVHSFSDFVLKAVSGAERRVQLIYP